MAIICFKMDIKFYDVDSKIHLESITMSNKNFMWDKIALIYLHDLTQNKLVKVKHRKANSIPHKNAF